MNSAELLETLTRITNSTPIRTRYNCGGEITFGDKFPTVAARKDGSIVVTIETDATTNKKAAIGWMNKIRAAFAAEAGAERTLVSKKCTESGFWHMQCWHVSAIHLRFLPAGFER